MGRPRTVTDTPACPQAGHAGSHVVLAGTYGKAQRQLFRCVPEDGPAHRFAGGLPRLIVEGGVCSHCDNPIHRHQGPALTAGCEFHLRLAAQALMDVGTGLTYTEAAARARVASGRGPYEDREPTGALVAEWVDVLAPVLLREHATVAWPETVVLDSTNFLITNPRVAAPPRQAFAIVAIYGYEQGDARGRPLGLYAAHDDVTSTYVEALAYLEDLGNAWTGAIGRWDPPAMVLTDNAKAVVGGVHAYWNAGIGVDCGPGSPRPFHKQCEWHLRRNAKATLSAHRIGGLKHWMRQRLDTALMREEGWQEFADRGAQLPGIDKWVHDNDAQVRAQASRRTDLPQHHTAAAADQLLARIRQQVRRRSFTFRNQRRMNLLLGLMCLHEQRVDTLDHYTETPSTTTPSSSAGRRRPAAAASRDSGRATALAASTTSARDQLGQRSRKGGLCV